MRRGARWTRSHPTGMIGLPERSYATPPPPSGVWSLPAARDGWWATAGVASIPTRPTFTTLSPSGGIDGPAIQAALNACPPEQAVALTAGEFKIRDNTVVQIPSYVTLRGAGAGVTTLRSVRADGVTNGTTRHPTLGYIVDNYAPLILIGPSRFPSWQVSSAARNLQSDAVIGTTTITVTSAVGLTPGQHVVLDEDQFFSGAYQALPDENGLPNAYQIWASDRIVWAKHNPRKLFVDDFDPGTPAAYGVGGVSPDNALGWFSRGGGRTFGEVKEIAAISGNQITFTTPITVTYRAAAPFSAQICPASDPFVVAAGVEDLTCANGTDGGIHLLAAAHSWVRRCEVVEWLGHGIKFALAHRCEATGCYVHYGAWPVPGGGGYAFALSHQATGIRIENSIAVDTNKCLVANAAGAGSVIGYNYFQDAQIWDGITATGWQEVHLNGSHFAGSHSMLFEGNEAANADSDFTHGAAWRHTFYRNRLTGSRRAFAAVDAGNERCYGLAFGSYQMTFVGNVLGEAGEMAGWTYDAGPLFNGDNKNVRKLGYDPTAWDQAVDPVVLATVLEQENYDHLRSTRNNAISDALPVSLYRTAAPAFFGAHPWPWVDPITGVTQTLPARLRLDLGTPNSVP